MATREKYSHAFGLNLLYTGPRIRIMAPRMIKLAATSGVGPIIVAVILFQRLDQRVKCERNVQTH